MKLLVTIIMLWFATGDTVYIEDVREAYKISSISEENAERFYELTERALQNKEAIYKGYHGAALALKASFFWNPIKKLSYFNRAKKMIDAAIEQEPKNIELRMIRLSIQYNAPRIGGYYQNIKNDRNFILSNVNQIVDGDLKIYIENFITYSKIFIK